MSNSQELFWKETVGKSYAIDNSTFDLALGVKAWKKMLGRIQIADIASYLECGSNIGRNIQMLQELIPNASASIVEIANLPYTEVLRRFSIHGSYLGSIKESEFDEKFDLVFTSGVLIHVNPADLLETMARMNEHSNRYILIAEYFNRTPISIDYRGESDKLFKMDFGKFFVENFEVDLVDYGFLWGHEFDASGFDDITYWLFEKQ